MTGERGAGVKQQLWGFRLREGKTCAVGDDVMDGSRKLGTITSVTEVGARPDAKGQAFALAYLRSRQNGAPVDLEGKQVAIAGVPAKVRVP